MINAKQKGNTFERKIARILSIWAYGAEYPRILSRTPTSGATHAFADMCMNEIEISKYKDVQFPLFPFTVECKFDKRADLQDFVFSDKGFLNEVWTKVEKEAQLKGNNTPIIITRIKRKDFVILKQSTYYEYFSNVHIPYYCVTDKNNNAIFIFELDSLFIKSGVLFN